MKKTFEQKQAAYAAAMPQSDMLTFYHFFVDDENGEMQHVTFEAPPFMSSLFKGDQYARVGDQA
jgi:hypothetical protein